MQNIEPLNYGNYYHIYNRGINSCNLFQEADNYEHFLGLFDKYISPVADTYAWVLLPNHFHLMVRVKEEEEIAALNRHTNIFPIYLMPIQKHLTNAIPVMAICLSGHLNEG